MILTSQNYHSIEANLYYMSNSQFKSFEECEAKVMAELSGAFIAPSNDNFLLGSYVHAYVEGTLDQFKESTPELFTNKGQLYSKYEVGDAMIQTIKNDEFIRFVLQGDKELIMTAELFGVPWKVKLDVLNQQRGRIVDLKTVKGLRERYWNKEYGAWESFIEHYKYIRQMAIYAEVERVVNGRENWLEPLIVAVSKESVPDKEVIGFDAERLKIELDEVAEKIGHIMEVKRGLVAPRHCGHCAYCKQIKKLRSITHYSDLAV